MKKNLLRLSGDGGPANPFLYEVEVTNPGNDTWEGNLHVEVQRNHKNPRFFMPAFLYGRNRGEVDRHPDSKMNPRLRECTVEIPYSPYWMVRSDRLSHPVSMIYAADSQKAIEDISTAIYQDSYIDEIRNYSTMVSMENNTVKKLPHASISWTGGVEIATPLLMAALRMNREDIRTQALECIQNIVDHSMNRQSGLPFDAFMDGKWTTEGWWSERLTHLMNALDYEFSFKFAYNVPIQVPPLSKIGWSSSGGSVTSTANPHIHPMSNNIVDEIYYCYQKSGNSYYNERLQDTLGWGLQTYNRQDGEYDFGKKGWMSERFCHSEGFLMEKYPDGSPSSTWFYFLPWGASNVLEGLCGNVWPLARQ